ncbi:hypothetical protein QE152_g38460 [Popillia japonica]|uniref:Uncharacterized protein n=1 Tax=Popillia japonica TaxID=7064 RepID=A0AAW1HX49_POPJA
MQVILSKKFHQMENASDIIEEISRTSTPTSVENNPRRSRNIELKLLADAIESRTQVKKEIEERKLEQRERLINVLHERNELLKSLVTK